MKITFKLYASLSKYLPDNTIDNKVDIEIGPEMSVYDILESHGIPRESVHLVLKNGIYIHPHERGAALFVDGDTLALWPPVAGG